MPAARPPLPRQGEGDRGRGWYAGLGRDVRLQHEGLTAAALVHDDTVVHLTAFEQDE